MRQKIVAGKRDSHHGGGLNEKGRISSWTKTALNQISSVCMCV